jgi:hypothetical protein
MTAPARPASTASPPDTKPPPERAGGGLQKASFPGGIDGPASKTIAANSQAAFMGLRREFACEALRIAAVKALHAADDIEIGDDYAAERELGVAVAHMREGAKAFRELQAALCDRGPP